MRRAGAPRFSAFVLPPRSLASRRPRTLRPKKAPVAAAGEPPAAARPAKLIAGEGKPPCKPEFAAKVGAAVGTQNLLSQAFVPLDKALLLQTTATGGAIAAKKAEAASVAAEIVALRAIVEGLARDLRAVQGFNAHAMSSAKPIDL